MTGRARSRARTIGLALGGGAFRGAAHVGVLEVLEREGIEPALITGTSVGSVVGAARAAGVTAARMSELVRELRWRQLLHVSFRRRMSLLDSAPLAEYLEQQLGITTFDALRVPFATVACDITNGERVVLRSGRVAAAVQASVAVPGLFPPVELDGRLLVDGGLVDNLPVELARELGADFVIAVDLDPPPTGTRRPTNLLEMLIAARNVRDRASRRATEAADCLILPDTGDSLGWDPDEMPELEAKGREAAEQSIGPLKAALGLLD